MKTGVCYVFDILYQGKILVTLTNLLSTDIKKGDISRLFINY